MTVLRSRKTRIALTVFTIFVLYVAGMHLRQRNGFRLVIRNESGEAIHQVSLKVENIGQRYELPDLAPSQKKRVFVQAAGKSHINLEFTDPRNVRHVETVVGYISSPSCGSAATTVNQGFTVDSTPSTQPLFCWDSWFGFI